jgi:hypothetical protein
LKQGHFHQIFQRRCYRVSILNISKPKIHSLIEISFSKLFTVLYFLIVQERKTNLHWVVRLPLVNVLLSVYILLWTIPLRWGVITLDEPVSREAVCAPIAFSWLALNNSWLSEVLLEELATILFIRCTTDFLLNIYTN